MARPAQINSFLKPFAAGKRRNYLFYASQMTQQNHTAQSMFISLYLKWSETRFNSQKRRRWLLRVCILYQRRGIYLIKQRRRCLLALSNIGLRIKQPARNLTSARRPRRKSGRKATRCFWSTALFHVCGARWG